MIFQGLRASFKGGKRLGLLVVWFFYFIIALLLMGRWPNGWLIGSFWWDEVAVLGGVAAIKEGLVPAVDFWAPFLLPLYIKMLAHSLVVGGGAYVVECLVQGAVIVIFYSALVWRRVVPPVVHLLACWAVLIAVMPFNIGSLAEAKVGAVAFAGSYNRLGSGLLSLMYVFPVVHRVPRKVFAWADEFWVAILLLVAFSLKISVFQIGVVLFSFYAIFMGAGWGFLARLVLLVAPILFFFCWGTSMGRGYVGAIHDVSMVRLSRIAERHDIYPLIFVDHRFELFVALFFSLIASLRGGWLRARWVALVVWYLLCLFSLVAYVATNYGDAAFFPLVVLMCSFYLLCCECGLSCDLKKWRKMLLLPLLLFFIYAFQSGVWFFGVWSFAAQSKTQVLAHGDGFFGGYKIASEDFSKRVPLNVPGVSTNLHSPSSYAAYVDGVVEAERYLVERFPNKSLSVYALDFPAYVFSVSAGYRIPRGSYPWLLYGHELTIDQFPAGRSIFADVDILAVSKCSLVPGNRGMLHALYRVELESRWRLERALRCWSVYTKR